jgi:hypothetical protein
MATTLKREREPLKTREKKHSRKTTTRSKKDNERY